MAIKIQFLAHLASSPKHSSKCNLTHQNKVIFGGKMQIFAQMKKRGFQKTSETRVYVVGRTGLPSVIPFGGAFRPNPQIRCAAPFDFFLAKPTQKRPCFAKKKPNPAVRIWSVGRTGFEPVTSYV
jgi:hypothetical protein